MPQSDPALPLRVSSHQREGLRKTVDPERPRLRLLVTKGQLGVELDAPFALGPLQIEELALSFPHLKFPVELSGGVDTFRNRRGELERLRLTVSGAQAQRWAGPRLAKALAAPLVHHMVAPLEDGWLIGAATEDGALVFEVTLAPLDGDLRLLPTHARAVGFGEAPAALAMRALAALTQPFGKSAGSAVIIERGPMELARELLPLAGMRAPAARAMRWSRLLHDLDGAVLLADRHEVPMAIAERTVSAVEQAALAAEAERHLLAGEIDDARRWYLDALTRAPRHLELARRLAELDLAVGGRAEAALSTLAEVQSPIDAGPLGAQLLHAVGDESGARTAWRRAAAAEPFAPLAALCWLELGKMEKGEAAERALDEAIARAPTLTSARWLRFDRLVAQGRIDDARADVEHLEAQAEGSQARLEVLCRAADRLLEQRVLTEAGELFERALRYVPTHIGSIAGLSRSLALLGHKRRSLELLSRASALVERSGQPAPRVTLDFARALAEIADDRPAAIAQLSRVEHMTAACYEARLLEARWRVELGDLAGASASLSRLADALEAISGVLVAEDETHDRLWSGPEALFATRVDARRALAALAEEGARIHELDRGDLPAARRLLETALRFGPRVRSIRAAYKRVAAEADVAPEPAPELPKPPTQRSSDPAPAGMREAVLVPASSEPLPGDTVDGEALEVAALAARAEMLTARVQGSPEDENAVAELIDVLARLDRHHELLALLSARIDDAPEDLRPSLLAQREVVLRKLIAHAKAEGRTDEANLYALMLDQS